MSVAPFYLRLLDDLTPASIFDQDFGLGILSDDLIAPRSSRCPNNRLVLHPSYGRHAYLRPWTQGHSGSSSLTNNKDEFKVNLDVQQFKPEEITVKVVDNHVVIDGKHEERQDEHGYITREFKRRYLLPDDVDPAQVASSLSSDGVLSVHAPKKQKQLADNVRQIPVIQTNTPAVKEAPKKNEANGDKMEQ